MDISPNQRISPSSQENTKLSGNEQATVLRILDANMNRATEGLRVIEEFTRFSLEDQHLTSLCKQLRHDLATLLSEIPADWLLVARETETDVGTNISAADEYDRNQLSEVLTANLKRLEQSLRCLEEYGKTLSPSFAASVESLRYRTYTLAKALEITTSSRERLAESRLYLLIDGGASEEAFVNLAKTLIEAGASILQLRDKKLEDPALLQRARILRQLTRDTDTLLIINDRPDLALLAKADGVHLGQNDLSVKDARSIVGPQALVGVSTHSIQQARQAVIDGANYIGCGPTFPSQTKSFSQFPGLDFLNQVSREISLPAFAIGGMTADNLSQVLETGFTRIALAGAVSQAVDPASQVGRLRQLLAPANNPTELTQ